ncbi:GGDEF domain-containing protein [Aestuariibacter halophilus]|uniref:diguanylate cyclase n=1 Tax=Fluctibacter halophilus TaxID=226011 RepID=A0ABS8GAI2_9ALTE|nr:GGDEF domain-containing protein [Aestuariibacter halophilus]MCC2617449.1 GGDEF domain-containing protein [Aestuariibacter halophilus]
MLSKPRQIDEYILLTLSGATAVALTPFAIYRIWTHEWNVAILDSAAVLLAAVLWTHVWRTGQTLWAGRILASLCLIVAIITLLLRGAEQILWVYPALTATFFLIPPRIAAVMATILLAVATIILWPELTQVKAAEFLVSSIATMMFSFAFADRMRDQHKRLELLANQDALTGAGNRHAMEKKLLDVMAFQRRNQDTPASLIILDLDRFKTINDTHGHGVGDAVLIELVKTISGRIRSTDTVFRFGGEEFVVIAENTSLPDASVLAEELCCAVRNNPYLREYHVTVSIGTAQFKPSESAFEWLGRADKAMYRAKESGRDGCFTG